MVKITIDNITREVKEGITILDAAREFGINIPTLCHHPKLTPFGGCRMCIVEVKGIARPLTSCTTPVSEGMEVTTNTPEIEALRKTVLELMLSDYPTQNESQDDTMICEKTEDSALQRLADFYGIKENRFSGERRIYEKSDGNPFIRRDMEKCILCARCVKVCDEVQGVSAIDFAYRGFKSKITPAFENDLDCEFCGQCVAVCPTGALTGKMWKQSKGQDSKEVETVCPYCGTGCNITLHVKGNEVIKVTSKEDKWNEGWLCVKGRFGYSFINSPDRLKKPLIRKNGRLTEASWDEALNYTAQMLKTIKSKHGPDSIAGLSSAKCTNEENYLFQKFMRAAVGTNNVDHCARL